LHNAHVLNAIDQLSIIRVLQLIGVSANAGKSEVNFETAIVYYVIYTHNWYIYIIGNHTHKIHLSVSQPAKTNKTLNVLRLVVIIGYNLCSSFRRDIIDILLLILHNRSMFNEGFGSNPSKVRTLDNVTECKSPISTIRIV